MSNKQVQPNKNNNLRYTNDEIAEWGLFYSHHTILLLINQMSILSPLTIWYYILCFLSQISWRKSNFYLLLFKFTWFTFFARGKNMKCCSVWLFYCLAKEWKKLRDYTFWWSIVHPTFIAFYWNNSQAKIHCRSCWFNVFSFCF